MHNSKESTNDEKGEKTKSDQISRKIDVCIVGGGFAGMNAARILSEKQISCEIFSSGTGASNLWAGTFDVVESSDKQPSKLKEDVDRLSKKVPGHPYNALRWSEVLLAMESFFEQIPNFRQFKDDKGSYLNRNVLTMLGKSKPCAASWNTIFCGMKELVETQRPCIVVNFVEFNNSTSNLIVSGLARLCDSPVEKVDIQLRELIENSESNSRFFSRANKGEVSLFQLSKLFESDDETLVSLSQSIAREINKLPQQVIVKFQEEQRPKPLFLFPPVMGVKETSRILRRLQNLLGGECFETSSLFPSIMANRAQNDMKHILGARNIPINNGKTLVEVKRAKNQTQFPWLCKFVSRKDKEISIACNNVILAFGSVFAEGAFGTQQQCIDFGTFESDFELQPGAYVCGSATYMFCPNIDDEQEIEFKTGLGFAVISADKVARTILSRIFNF